MLRDKKLPSLADKIEAKDEALKANAVKTVEEVVEPQEEKETKKKKYGKKK